MLGGKTVLLNRFLRGVVNVDEALYMARGIRQFSETVQQYNTQYHIAYLKHRS